MFLILKNNKIVYVYNFVFLVHIHTFYMYIITHTYIFIYVYYTQTYNWILLCMHITKSSGRYTFHKHKPLLCVYFITKET